MEPDEQDVVPTEHRLEVGEVEVIRGPGIGHAVAPERRGVEHDPAAVFEPIAAADRGADARQPLLAEQDIRARDPVTRHEPLRRLPKRLRVMDGRRLRRDQADVVVRVDRDPPRERLVHPERLVQHAVTDLLECAAGVPCLDDRGTPPRPDDVDREVIVIDDEDPRRGQLEAGCHGMDGSNDPAAQAPSRLVSEGHHADVRCARGQIRADGRQVAGQPRAVRGGQDHAATERQQPSGDEPDPDQGDPDRQDQAAHEAMINSSMTRSVDPPSRWAKCRAANEATLSAS